MSGPLTAQFLDEYLFLHITTVSKGLNILSNMPEKGVPYYSKGVGRGRCPICLILNSPLHIFISQLQKTVQFPLNSLHLGLFQISQYCRCVGKL